MDVVTEEEVRGLIVQHVEVVAQDCCDADAVIDYALSHLPALTPGQEVFLEVYVSELEDRHDWGVDRVCTRCGCVRLED